MKRRGTWSIVMLAALAVGGCGGEQADKTAAGDGKSPAAKTAGKTDLIPAVPGVGGKGSDLDPGPIATPIQAMWTAKERIQFIEIGRPMQIYMASHGHFPKTQGEFMAKIVQEYGLQWPAEFIYDPEAAAKMTEYDANNPPFLRKRGGD
jgi:hypothetical protein